MRSLIRAGILWVAIPGMMISVAAWGYANWNVFRMHEPIPPIEFVSCDRPGWAMNFTIGLPTIGRSYVTLFDVGGIAFRFNSQRIIVEAPHWFVITTFSLLSVFGHFMKCEDDGSDTQQDGGEVDA